MARTFANPSGISCSPGAIGTLLGGAFTLAAIARRTSDNDYHALISIESSGGGHRGGLWITNGGGSGGDLQIVSSGFDTSFGFTIPNNTWVFLAVTKADGDSITPNGWMYRYDTDAWSTAAGAGTVNEDSDTISTIRIGNSEGADFWFIGDIEIEAGWSSALADAQIRQLPFSLQAWYASAPTFGHLLDQQATGQNVIDWTGGGANQSALSNTSVSTTSVPVFTYGFSDLAPHSAPAGGTDATATPAAIAVTVSVPAATLSLGATATPAVLAATATLPAASVSAGSTVTPAATAAVASLPAASVSAASTVTPAAIAAAGALPAATVSAGATATPASIATVAALPAVTVSAGGSATVAPETIATTTSLPAAAPSAGSTVTPAQIAAIAALPAAAISAGSTVTPAAVAATAALPAATAQASSTVSPATIPTIASVPLASLVASSTALPAAIAAVVSMPLATVGGQTVKGSSVATVTATVASTPTVAAGRTSAAAVSATYTSSPGVS